MTCTFEIRRIHLRLLVNGWVFLSGLAEYYTLFESPTAGGGLQHFILHDQPGVGSRKGDEFQMPGPV